jgi:hypothetical protein
VDKASIYTKYYEYHFLNRQIIWFDVPIVQIEVCLKIQEKEKTNEI